MHDPHSTNLHTHDRYKKLTSKLFVGQNLCAERVMGDLRGTVRIQELGDRKVEQVAWWGLQVASACITMVVLVGGSLYTHEAPWQSDTKVRSI